MKKIMMALMIALAGVSFTTAANAQVNISINIGSQPGWGPTGYNHVDFYYLPQINSYYDINKAQFIYLSGNRWVYGASLPGQYRNYDLYRMYKVVVNQPNPYRYNQTHVREYARYKNNYSQPVIRDSKDRRYYASAGHPNHNQWQQDRNNGLSTGSRGNSGKNDKKDNNRNSRNQENNRVNNGPRNGGGR